MLPRTILIALALTACSDSAGPGIAVTLNLHSIDGKVVPAEGITPGGRRVSIASGKLQGTNWGHACGVALRLVEGPLTAAEIPDCKVSPGEERIFTLQLNDSRFPAGPHEYRFVP